MSLSIRCLGPGDEHVLAMLAEQAADFDLAGRTPAESPLPDDEAAAYLADPSVLHWVAQEDGKVVGELLCHVLPLPSEHGRELLLYAIGVRDGHRRHGAGRALIHTMLDWATTAGIPLVWVLADNPGAEAFYTACGFRRAPEGEQGLLLTLDIVPGNDH